jgi:hypothetical protein
LELLQKAKAFEGSAVKPAFRANDTSEIWGARPASYGKFPSRPFRTANLSHVAEAKLTDLGLYSITFLNDVDSEVRALEAFKEFRADAAANGIKYFLEVFNPNVDVKVATKDFGTFVNDNVMRSLSGILQRDRPQFLKYPYNGPRALEEIVAYDPEFVIGVLGGGAGTTRDTFELLYQAEKYGARVALFGRKILGADSPLDIVRLMRAVADGKLKPLEAVREYHAELKKKKIVPARSIDEDSKVTESRSRRRLPARLGHTAVARRDRLSGARPRDRRAPFAARVRSDDLAHRPALGQPDQERAVKDVAGGERVDGDDQR